MLNPFPELLAFGLLAPFIIRICLGVMFIRHGYFKLFKNHDEPASKTAKNLTITIGSIEVIGGITLLLGFLTQISALILATLVFVVTIFKKRSGETTRRDLGFAAFVFLILISLLFSGAGFFAFDIPL